MKTNWNTSQNAKDYVNNLKQTHDRAQRMEENAPRTQKNMGELYLHSDGIYRTYIEDK